MFNSVIQGVNKFDNKLTGIVIVIKRMNNCRKTGGYKSISHKY